MTRASASRVAILLATVAVVGVGCGGGSPTAPSNVPSAVQGTVALAVFQFAVVHFSVDRAGTLSSRVDWSNANNDIDTALLRGRCTVDQVLGETQGCNEAAAIASDDSFSKPSVFSPAVQSGDHTLIIFNWGPGADTSSYRIEGSVSGATSPTLSPGLIPSPGPNPSPSPAPSPNRRTDTFGFTLLAGSQQAVVMGPVRAGNGPVDVALTFSGGFIILACVGTQSSCTPMGGRPTTRSFTIPADFPAGPIQATVYFNRNLPQPPGNAMGTVSFTYNPL